MAKQYKGILETLLEDLERQGKQGYRMTFENDKMRLNLPPELRPPRKRDLLSNTAEIGGPGDPIDKTQYDDENDQKQLSLPPSSTIQSAAYFPVDKYLLVSFKSGATYSYDDVPMETIERWERAQSAGSHFYYNIRKSFSYNKM